MIIALRNCLTSYSLVLKYSGSYFLFPVFRMSSVYVFYIIISPLIPSCTNESQNPSIFSIFIAAFSNYQLFCFLVFLKKIYPDNFLVIFYFSYIRMSFVYTPDCTINLRVLYQTVVVPVIEYITLLFYILLMITPSCTLLIGCRSSNWMYYIILFYISLMPCWFFQLHRHRRYALRIENWVLN